MLTRHSAIYFVGRGIPGLINFATLAAYTHLLSPQQYGWYALVLVAVLLTELMLFAWLRFAVYRLVSAYANDGASFIATVARRFVLSLAVSAVFCLAGIALLARVVPMHLLALGTLLLWSHATLELTLALAGARLQPIRFGALTLLKTVIAFGVGVALALSTGSAAGCLAGMIAGNVAGSIAGAGQWRGARAPESNIRLASRLASFGMPLAASAVLGLATAALGRVIIGWFDGADAAGLYSVSFDLAQQSLFMLMSAINLAAYPITVHALETHGPSAVQGALGKQAGALLVVGIPAAAGLALLAPVISATLLGTEFVRATTMTLPLLALSVLLTAFRMLYFDLSFQLTHRTAVQLRITAGTLAGGLVIHLVLIAMYGMMGAVYATLLTSIFSFALTAALAHRLLPLPIPWRVVTKIVASTGVMCLALLPLRAADVHLALLVVGGLLVYAGAMAIANGAQITSHMRARGARTLNARERVLS